MEGKMKRRFFEPLILLRALSQAQGDRIEEESGPFSDDLSNREAQQIRRDVLAQLCRVCDFRKGGETVTAMALEKSPPGPVYWVSIPESHRERIITFLRETLDSIHREMSREPTKDGLSELQASLASKFVQFAIQRLRDTRKLLQKHIHRAVEVLARRTSTKKDLSALIAWLEDLRLEMSDKGDLHEQSKTAYVKVRSAEMRQIKDTLDGEAATGDGNEQFLVRHYLGRLASSERASKILVQAGQRQSWLFDGYEIEAVTCRQASAGPGGNQMVTLDAIIQRMLPAKDPRLASMKSALLHLDATMGLTDSVRSYYQDPHFVLRVHAEIALLEAVHDQDIEFYDGDKYLACSKAACFCCYHYICRHPGQFVRPPSHNKIWLNWGVPATNGSIEGKSQRDLLIDVNNAVRKSAIDKILSRSGRRKSHPDSTTGTGVTTNTVPWFNAQIRQLNVASVGKTQSTSTVNVVEADTPTQSEDESDSNDGGVSLLAAQISSCNI